MPRLRNVVSGAVVEVPDEKVAQLGSQWEPAKASEPKKKATVRRSQS